MVERTCTRRRFLQGAAVTALGLCAGRAGHAASKARKPNFVLIMADDLGYGDLGCYGNTRIKTPNLDALAAEGLRFTDFHSNAPVCSPTRAALVTGRYQQRTGIDGVITAKGHRDTGMPLDEITFAEILAPQGYDTAIFGKWHLGYPAAFNPVHQGFDTFRGYVSGNVDYHSHIDMVGEIDWWRDDKLEAEEGYVTDLITEHGVRFIEDHIDAPFCLYLAHEAPHFPLQGRNDKADREPGDPHPTQGSRKDKENAYKEMIEAMDEGIGRIVESLRRCGIEDNTLIFFCSDNGATKLGSNGPLRGNKGGLWEGGHRVPAIGYWPGRIRPGESQATAMTMDLFPTMAALAGAVVPPDRPIDGVDLTGHLLRREALPERTLFWRFKRRAAVRKGPWKLVADKSVNEPDRLNPARLFNLENDLGEQDDLAEKHPDMLVSLIAAYWTWEREVTENVTMRA
ncbi:MAG: sulfatase-like hydrolase/transferase [Candidatus Hydrogenedentota bacterium]